MTNPNQPPSFIDYLESKTDVVEPPRLTHEPSPPAAAYADRGGERRSFRIPGKGKLLKLAVAGAAVLGVETFLSDGLLQFGSSSRGESVLTSLGKVENDGVIGLRSAQGKSIYSVHTCFGCSVPLWNEVSDVFTGRTLTAGLEGTVVLSMNSSVKEGAKYVPSYSWSTQTEKVSAPTLADPKAVKTEQVTTVNVKEAALREDLRNPGCIVENGKCLGNIGESVMKKAEPLFDIGIAVVPVVGWLGTGVSIAAYHVLEKIFDGSAQDGSRQLAVSVFAGQQLINSCGNILAARGSVIAGEQAFFHDLLASNSAIKEGLGQTQTAFNLSKAADGKIIVNVIKADGTPDNSPILNVARAPKVTAAEISKRFGGGQGSLATNPGTRPCSRTSFDNYGSKVPGKSYVGNKQAVYNGVLKNLMGRVG